MFLADGFEEVEALAPYDVLVRGGVNVKTVCLNEDNFVTSSHKTVLLAKYTFKEFLKKLEQEGTSREDVMIFPGGMPGSTNLAACKPLMEAAWPPSVPHRPWSLLPPSARRGSRV